MFLKILLTLAVTSTIASVSGQACYHPDQTSSSDKACGFSTSYCCEPNDTCVTQGLCQDRNNHLNGSLTYLQGAEEPGPYNYTGLYKTASCTNENWSNCINHCPSSDDNKTAYIWACNDELTLFCCEQMTGLAQSDCCNGPTWSILEALALNVSLRATTPSSQTTSSGSTVSVITIFTVPATTTNATSISPTSDSTSTPSAKPFRDKNEGLSTGSKIGLGVGIAIGLVSIIALAFFWHKKRNSKAQDKVAYVDQPQQQVDHSYMPFQPSELEPQDVRELYVDSKPIELAPRRNVAHELSI